MSVTFRRRIRAYVTLQHLKQQYQQKQMQLQEQRQQLLSQAASSNPPDAALESTDELSKRQPIPLHIALQNHLHVHQVTESNVGDLAHALSEWDTRDRSISLSSSQIMVSVNAHCALHTLPLNSPSYAVMHSL